MYNNIELGSDIVEHEHKWFSPSRLAVTIGLLLALMLVIFIEISLFISGPSIRYEDKITKQIETITSNYENLEDMDRHVFQYIIYSAHDEQSYYWFNENGEMLTRRDRTEIDMEKAKQIALTQYQIEASSIRIGYGYKNPVYVIENESMELYLDLDTLAQVFVRRKGGTI